jgi:hypothetical protein
MEVASAHSFLATLGRGTEIVPLCLSGGETKLKYQNFHARVLNLDLREAYR